MTGAGPEIFFAFFAGPGVGRDGVACVAVVWGVGRVVTCRAVAGPLIWARAAAYVRPFEKRSVLMSFSWIHLGQDVEVAAWLPLQAGQDARAAVHALAMWPATPHRAHRTGAVQLSDWWLL